MGIKFQGGMEKRGRGREGNNKKCEGREKSKKPFVPDKSSQILVRDTNCVGSLYIF